MDYIPLIKDASKVIEVFGYFPMFHDAEVVSMVCSRGETDSGIPTLEFTVHGWEMTSDVTDSGYYVLDKHHLIDFKFYGVDSVDLHHWNHQNVLFELIIKSVEKPSDHALLEVEFSSSFGLEGSFRASSGEIVGVRPCDEHGISLPNRVGGRF